MKDKLFVLTAAAICGPLVAFAPVSAFAGQPGQGNHARYYYLSMSGLARSIENTGFMKFINVNGEKILYTHSNLTGHKPTADAELVSFSFGGQAPVETHPVVNKAAYTAYKARIGAKFVPPLRETTTVATTKSAASRPQTQAAEFPQNKLG